MFQATRFSRLVFVLYALFLILAIVLGLSAFLVAFSHLLGSSWRRESYFSRVVTRACRVERFAEVLSVTLVKVGRILRVFP